MATKDRQAAYKARQRDLGRKQVTAWMTEEEEYYLMRTLVQMRKTGGTPAMLRKADGRMEPIDV